MPIIGTFADVKDGYAGTIRTLTMSVRMRLIANDRKDAEVDRRVRCQVDTGTWKVRCNKPFATA
jgi:uncharacterized protein (DUF736 family)